MTKQKKQTFLIFTTYRIILFCGLFGIVIFAHLFGHMMWRHYVGTSNAFNHTPGTLAVHYLDVGQGDAIVIQLPSGRVVMIDSGTHWHYTRVKTYLTTRVLTGVNRTIDYIIATHSHDDHIGGFSRLLVDFDVGTVFRPHNKSTSHFDTEVHYGAALAPLADTENYAEFITAAYTYANYVRFIEAGITITSPSGLYQLYFHTPSIPFIHSLRGDIFSDFNDISPIISLRYRNHLFLFTGDAGMKAENQFRECPRAQALDFENLQVYLKVAHHGSRHNTTVNFLEFIKPDKAIISVGMRNVHGHPHDLLILRLETVAELQSNQILETRHLGNIVIVIDADSTRMFFAFDNEIDLRFVYVTLSAILFFACFVNFSFKKA